MRRSRGNGRAASLCCGLPAARAGVWRRRGAACKAWRCGEGRFRAVGRSSYHPAFLAGYAASQRENTSVEACSPMKPIRSEEHTSELQSLMRISYAVFCVKKKKIMLNLIIQNSYHTTHLDNTD